MDVIGSERVYPARSELAKIIKEALGISFDPIPSCGRGTSAWKLLSGSAFPESS